MTLAELESLSKGWNPYYMAFAIEHGFKTPKEAFEHFGGNGEFFIWNSARWEETCDRFSLNRNACSAYYKEHMEVLSGRLSQMGRKIT